MSIRILVLNSAIITILFFCGCQVKIGAGASSSPEPPHRSHTSRQESELKTRLSAANSITNMQMRNEALSGLAIDTAKMGYSEFTMRILGQITDMTLRNQTAKDCALNLAVSWNSQDAIRVAQTITDMTLRNETLMSIATLDYK
jgi:hypothetical protein